MLRLFIRALVVVVVLGGSQATASVGAPFPDLVDIDGTPVTTAADVGVGKWQLVMLWTTNCHICAEMKPLLSAFHDKHKGTDALVYGISLDGHQNTAAVKRYMSDHKVTFPTFIGELGMVAINFEINSETPLSGTPTYMLFNPAGELMAIDFGMLDIAAIERFMLRNS